MYKLYEDIASGSYKHGPYKTFTVCDNKKREIRVASIRDRVVHRLIYDYLVALYDHTFIYNVWSCRENKGLIGAITRSQHLLSANPHAYVWRADISKFFDNVGQSVLWGILARKVKDPNALKLLEEIIASYPRERERERDERPSGVLPGFRRGMPIGNLTSQILANIYLNELDRFVKHTIKPKAYLRYGDDFILVASDLEWLRAQRQRITVFLASELKLSVNRKSDIIIKTKNGIHFLGVEIYPTGRRLKKRNWYRAITLLSPKNYSSYSGLVKQHGSEKKKKHFDWKLAQLYDEFI
ncbi:MAG: Reverse transcriptase (RNA-dependent DNA polymerase) [bacterium ADurb.Bin400]|nr:MAG: Reverse transcriptase (RNA-dependent DNA polymerase) [bacterium ADurb.Bin400]